VIKEKSSLDKLGPLARALARWENEGGKTDGDWKARSSVIQEENAILQCLGSALLIRWNALPTEIQRDLFNDAVSAGDEASSSQIKEQIARFLHTHTSA
jgi:hypothetical protein